MAIFLSNIPGLSTSMRIKGSVYRIKFTPREKPYNNVGVYATRDTDVINALRKHPYFGSFITEQVDETPAEVQAEKKEFAASYAYVTKSQEAKEILVSKHGADASTLTNKAAIKKAAEDLNIDFPNLK